VSESCRRKNGKNYDPAGGTVYMPITLRRWKEKATKYINAKFKKTGEGSLNYDLKVYLEERTSIPTFFEF
jgi:hypothetical protein